MGLFSSRVAWGRGANCYWEVWSSTSSSRAKVWRQVPENRKVCWVKTLKEDSLNLRQLPQHDSPRFSWMIVNILANTAKSSQGKNWKRQAQKTHIKYFKIWLDTRKRVCANTSVKLLLAKAQWNTRNVCVSQGHGPWSSHVFCPCVTQTDIQWMVHTQSTDGWFQRLIFERICFVQLYERKSLFWCVVEKNARWKCMKGRQTFLNGEKSICNRHSFFQYKWNIRPIGKLSLSLYFFVFYKVSE